MVTWVPIFPSIYDRGILSAETVLLDAEVTTMDEVADLVKDRFRGKLTEEQRNTVCCIYGPIGPSC